MTHTRLPCSGIRRAIRFVLIGFLLSVALPFGAVGPTSVFVVQSFGLLLGVLTLTLCVLRPELKPTAPRWLLIVPWLMVALGLLQLVPLPDGVLEILVGKSHALRQSVAEWQGMEAVLPRTLSSVPAESLDATLRLLAYCGIGLATIVAFRRRRDLRLLAWGICGAATFQAAYGSYEFLSGRQQIFGYVKRFYLEDASGTFINRNHFANFLAISLPFLWFLLLESLTTREAASTWKQRILRWTQRETLRRWTLLVCLSIVYVGLALSNSRAGLIAGSLATALVLFGSGRRRVVVTVVLIALLVPTTYLVTRQELTVGERFVELEDNLRKPGGRPTVWAATTQIVRDAPVFGAGVGGFEWVFPLYRPATIRTHWDHAHNDWLQLAAETGLVGLGLALLFFLGLLVALGRAEKIDETATRLRGAIVAAILTTGFHACFDFSLRIPANATFFVVACGAGLALLGIRNPATARRFRASQQGSSRKTQKTIPVIESGE
ncbi:MAG: O-antigen ligase family protein [Acidobacteriota bacterium]|nr:O-antigen ligase family protein [Acidobacteriota bacterium]MDH3784163.1 O-antigen ligase family protein [Acidobacteriota bacterium]